MKATVGGITAPKGFRAAGLSAGIKPNGSMDMSLLVSEVPAVCSAAFATNMVKSAAVLRNIEILKKYIKEHEIYSLFPFKG